jgi:tetratricopeptide (TPR) repeat protein
MRLVAVIALLSPMGIGADDARAHLGAGLRMVQAEDYERAAGEFEQALRLTPGLTEAREQLGVCYFETRRYDSARDIFSSTIGSGNRNLATYYLARIDLLENSFDTAIVKLRSLLEPESFRDAPYYLGSAYYKSQRYDQAVAMLERAARENERDFRAHLMLARAYQRVGRAADAEKEFRETERLHTYYTDGSVAIGSCRALLAGGNRNEALRKCVPLLDTDDVDKLAMLGMLFGEAGIDDQAHTAWSRALSLDPESPEFAYNLAFACFRLHKTSDSARYAADAVRLRPEFPEANALYGTVLYMLGRDAEAMAVLTHAHQLLPDDQGVSRLLAREQEITGGTRK